MIHQIIFIFSTVLDGIIKLLHQKEIQFRGFVSSQVHPACNYQIQVTNQILQPDISIHTWMFSEMLKKIESSDVAGSNHESHSESKSYVNQSVTSGLLI